MSLGMNLCLGASSAQSSEDFTPLEAAMAWGGDKCFLFSSLWAGEKANPCDF